ncbi:zinc finger protein 154-like [Crotalus tigris]|uniref:zinc finger protein 154-like n=1 Tax=Crotalus tigris TaxID=88082 RepID=UPI00192FA98B|nr:zinc finger protein 154-like [Crotalus tigris]
MHTNMVRYKRTHAEEKSYECPDCGKGFSWDSLLVQQRRNHTGEKTYECPDCGEKISWKSVLVKHQRTHTGEKPYKCHHCGESFSQNSYLVKEGITLEDKQLVIQIKNQKKPYECHHYGERFSQNSYLKLYECQDCGKGFSSNSNLVKHQRSHTGEKPHECPDCGKDFSNRSSLINHDLETCLYSSGKTQKPIGNSNIDGLPFPKVYKITKFIWASFRTVLNQKAGRRLTDARILRYEAIRMEKDDLVLAVENSVNPALFLSGNTEPNVELEHQSAEIIELQTKV